MNFAAVAARLEAAPFQNRTAIEFFSKYLAAEGHRIDYVDSRMSATKTFSAVESVLKDLLAELYTKSACEKFELSRESFATILCEVGQKYATPASTEPEIRIFFLSLRVDELALARACAQGNNSAWEIFLTRYRQKLYLSALRIAREDSAAHELADTLYADLYGTNTRDGKRVSKLASYTGRGSLEGWLRTVLNWLPWRYQIGFPVEVLTSAHDLGTALKMLGRDTGEMRLPMCAMDAALDAKLRETLKAYGLL